MTRKRFVKLLMGIGFQRNDAEVLAYWKRKWRKPYAKTWNDYAKVLSSNFQTWYYAQSEREAVLKDLNYLELHKNEK